jgi:hypothetical protein
MMLAERTMISHMGELIEFFQMPLDKVDPKILLLATKIKPRPDWLRGKTRLDDLPHFTRERLPYVFRYKNLLKQSEIAQRLNWIVENTHGKWCLADDGLYFEHDYDFHYFMWRWQV